MEHSKSPSHTRSSTSDLASIAEPAEHIIRKAGLQTLAFLNLAATVARIPAVRQVLLQHAPDAAELLQPLQPAVHAADKKPMTRAEKIEFVRLALAQTTETESLRSFVHAFPDAFREAHPRVSWGEQAKLLEQVGYAGITADALRQCVKSAPAHEIRPDAPTHSLPVASAHDPHQTTRSTTGTIGIFEPTTPQHDDMADDRQGAGIHQGLSDLHSISYPEHPPVSWPSTSEPSRPAGPAAPIQKSDSAPIAIENRSETSSSDGAVSRPTLQTTLGARNDQMRVASDTDRHAPIWQGGMPVATPPTPSRDPRIQLRTIPLPPMPNRPIGQPTPTPQPFPSPVAPGVDRPVPSHSAIPPAAAPQALPREANDRSRTSPPSAIPDLLVGQPTSGPATQRNAAALSDRNVLHTPPPPEEEDFTFESLYQPKRF